METELRKLRKKLREIERLQTHASLSEKEKTKLQKREEFQQRIAQILKSAEFNEGEPLSSEVFVNDDEDEIEFFVEHDESNESVKNRSTGRMKRKSTSEESEGGKVARLDRVNFSSENEPAANSDFEGRGDAAFSNGFHADDEGINSVPVKEHNCSSLDQQESNRKTKNVTSETAAEASVSQKTPPTKTATKSAPSPKPVAAPTVSAVTQKEKQQQQILGAASDVIKSPVAEQTKSKVVDWAKKLRFSGGECEGHNDMLFSVDSDGTLAVSGSRDTMLKVWDCGSGKELFSLLGHSGTVTCVQMIDRGALSKNTLKLIYENNDLDVSSVDVNDRFCVSGSHDCCLNLWNISKGTLVQSIYTFNAVSCLLFANPSSQSVANAFKQTKDCVIVLTGNEAGKIQVWNLTNKQNQFSVVGHEGAIMGLKASATRLYSCAADCLVKVWQVSNWPKELGENCPGLGQIFASESLKVVTPDSPSGRGDNYCLGRIRSMAVDAEEELIYIGDDGPNIKIVDWQNGLVYKLRNHRLAFGYTDAVQLSGKYLLASSFYLDTGKGSINIFHRPKKCQLKDLFKSYYISTLDEPSNSETANIGRIFCFKFTATDQKDPVSCSLIIGSNTLFNFAATCGTEGGGSKGKKKCGDVIHLQNKSFKWRVRVDDSDDGAMESQDNGDDHFHALASN